MSCGRTPARCSPPTPSSVALIEAASPPTLRALRATVARRMSTPCSTRRRSTLPRRRMDAATGGKQGVHTEHLGHLLAEMQFLQRAYPGARMVIAPRDASGRGAPHAAVALDAPALDALWDALAAVPDPEIPVVSVVELGIVRGVEWDGRRRSSSTSRRPIPAVPPPK